MGLLSQELLSKLILFKKYPDVGGRKGKTFPKLPYILFQISKLVCANMFLVQQLYLVGRMLV